MKLFYRRHYHKLGITILAVVCVTLLVNTYFLTDYHTEPNRIKREHELIHSNHLHNSPKHEQSSGGKHSDVSVLDVDIIKQNLFIVRKYLQAANHSKSGTSGKLLLEDKTGGEFVNKTGVEFLTEVEQEKSRRILEDSADTLLDIARLLQGVGHSKGRHFTQNR